MLYVTDTFVLYEIKRAVSVITVLLNSVCVRLGRSVRVQVQNERKGAYKIL